MSSLEPSSSLLLQLLLLLPHPTKRTPTIDPSLLTPHLLPPPNIPPTRTTTTHTHLNSPSKNTRRTRNPHKHKHLRSNIRSNIQFRRSRNHIAHNNKHYGRDHGCHGCEERGEKGYECEWEREPAREDAEGEEENYEEVEADAGEEEAEHPVGDGFDEVEDGVDVGGESDWVRMVSLACVGTLCLVSFLGKRKEKKAHLLRRREVDSE